MSTRVHQAQRRRALWLVATMQGGLNLIPLVDVLTSIVFFSLLTYGGIALASFPMVAPPAIAGGGIPRSADPVRSAVILRVYGDRLSLRDEAGEAWIDLSAGMSPAAITRLDGLLSRTPAAQRAASGVTIVPSDEVGLQTLVVVLERVTLAGFVRVSVGGVRRAVVVPAA